MTYTESGDTVTLTMTRDDHDQLMMLLGYALGAIQGNHSARSFYRALDFINRLNATHPRYTPYEIPEEYRP